MSKPNTKLTQDVLDALTISDRPVTSKQLGYRLPQYSSTTIRNALVSLSISGFVSSVKGPGGLRMYEVIRTRSNQRTYEWHEYVAPRPTVIPVRSRGRIAPNVSDGPYLGMGGSAGSTRCG